LIGDVVIAVGVHADVNRAAQVSGRGRLSVSQGAAAASDRDERAVRSELANALVAAVSDQHATVGERGETDRIIQT
jgi:ribosomal protein S7